MKAEIAERIKQIKDGKIPKGYKKENAYIIPKSWNNVFLGKIIKFKNGLNYGKNDIGKKIKILGVGDFKNRFLISPEELEEIQINSFYEEYLLKNGDLVFVRSNGNKDLIGRVIFCENLKEDITYSGFTIRGRLNSDEFIDKYCAYYCSSNLVKKQYMENGGGTNISNLNQKILSNIQIIKPSISEQKKIIEVINVWDKSISLKEKLIFEKEKQKQGLCERLLTGKVRLSGFSSEDKPKKLRRYITEIKLRNIDNKETRILSVTNKLGFILQADQFERVVASENLTSYKIVSKGEFAYNPSRINVGSIDLLSSFESGLLSPMYVIFKCNDGLIKEYLYYFLKSNLFLNYIPKLLQGSVRDSLSFDSLQTVPMFIPSVQEQKAISKILLTADKEINLLKKELEALKNQKKGLMQLLLTGIVRVKCD